VKEKGIHAVTGAFGFSGRYIASRLLESEPVIRTLTNSPERPHPFGDRVEVHPYHFDDPDKLVRALEGVGVLYNTYWVRFNHSQFTFAGAVENSRTLFSCAVKAGVERIVHVSITNNSLDSPLEYFRGKARLEEELRSAAISHAILRPALLFGREDILINNIAWVLRHFPAFTVFGDGSYRLQPIFVDDLARLAVEQGRKAENTTIEAIGPETYTFLGLVQEIGRAIGKRRPVFRVPPQLGYWLGKLVGGMKGDVLLTREEVRGLMAELLYVDAPAAGYTRLSDWMRRNRDQLGKEYRSELKRRLDRESAYTFLTG
jgi:NADH dehydrogenase